MESSKGYKNWRCATHLTSSRFALLQYQLQELSQRERRARNHNQKLLQDFQRAQKTLSDLVARTEAMNTIRMEYESYPNWQQKLQDKRLSEQPKAQMIEQQLNACTPEMEEDGQWIDRRNKHPFRIISPSALSPDPSHCPIFNSLPHISEHRDNMGEDPISRHGLFHPGSTQNMQGNIQNSIHSSIPSMWLTPVQPPVNEPEHSNISKNTKNIQNVHQALNSSLLDPNLLSGDSLHSLYSVVLQDPPSCEHLRQYPNSRASGSERFNLRVQCPTDCPSWSYLPLINGDTERREEEGRQKRQEASSNSQGKNHHMQKQRKKVNSRHTKPVNISNYYGDTSESSDLSSKAAKSLPTEVQRRRNKKRREINQLYNTRKDAVFQGSSSISDCQSVPNHKKHQRSLLISCGESNGRIKNPFKTSKFAVDSPKQLEDENKDDGSPIEGTLTSISCTVETAGVQRHENKEEEEEEEDILSIGAKQVNEVANRYSTENREKSACLFEEQDKEGEVEERCREQSSTHEEEAQEVEPLRSNTSVKESLLDEVESVRESEAEEGGTGEEEEDGEQGYEDEKIRASGRRSNKNDYEPDKEGNCNEVLVSGSEKSIQDSLRELYKDETEDDLAKKEANIEDEDDDDDDDVIVEKGSPWSCHPVLEDIKYDDEEEEEEEEEDDDDVIVEKGSPWSCHPVLEDTICDDDGDEDDGDDDIEGLLAPQNNSLQHQADEAEEILKSKGLPSDSEEHAPGKGEPVNSSDEFDHFYD
ncbi:hypothetical protein AMELA_G00037150 [Ameiurus melas]|uniref:Uncharacterized protein n=1 Tax=Ameiurus melas TaxID=219545 RepID=A0A7J6BBN0_AMEME|nr:hypothetical protein AMELA_G00037150 [Ameiurus melas]